MAGGTISAPTIPLSSSDVVIVNEYPNKAPSVTFDSGVVIGDVFVIKLFLDFASDTPTWISNVYVKSTSLNITICGRSMAFGTGSTSNGNGFTVGNVTSANKLSIRFYSNTQNAVSNVGISVFGMLNR